MVATHADWLNAAQQLDHLVGTCAVADHIAEVGNAIVLGSRVETGFQGLDIPMNVAEEE